MTGADALLRCRLAGRRPAQGVLVEIAAKRAQTVVAAEPERSIEDDGVALLTVSPDERVERLDLRCLVGLPVAVLAYSDHPAQAQVLAFCQAAQQAGAARVIGLQGNDGPLIEVFRHHADAPPSPGNGPRRRDQTLANTYPA